jgi:hypothetical protein
MNEKGKDKAEAAAATSVGAGVGAASGATVGVLELAAWGLESALLSGVMIGAGALAGGAAAYGLFKLLKKKSNKPAQAKAKAPARDQAKGGGA